MADECPWPESKNLREAYTDIDLPHATVQFDDTRIPPNTAADIGHITESVTQFSRQQSEKRQCSRPFAVQAVTERPESIACAIMATSAASMMSGGDRMMLLPETRIITPAS